MSALCNRRFRSKYVASLNELLISPVVSRGIAPALAEVPHVSAACMRDVASFGGYSAGAFRTALSRLRASGVVETFSDGAGTTRYRMSKMQRSISRVVHGRFARPQGFSVAVFSFATEDVRERRILRDTLRYHGFQKIAQNVYINGQVDTAEIEDVVLSNGLRGHLYLFRCEDVDDPVLAKRLGALFNLRERAKVLLELESDLTAFLTKGDVPDVEFARRYLYAAPIHYRMTFVDEPYLPARYLPPGYPLERIALLMHGLGAQRSRALVDYFQRFCR